MEKLPSEILIKIFENCRVLPLTMVCSKFNEVICNSPRLMKKLDLLITDKTRSSDLLTSVRNYQSVIFKFNYKINEDCIAVLTHFRGLKSLEFMRCILPAEVFHQILSSIPQLENISIYTTYLKNREDITRTLEPPRMINLKRLNFRTSDQKFFSFMKNSELKSLHIGYPVQYDISLLEDFLSNQPGVTSIEYLSVATLDEKLMLIITQKFKNLKKLHIEGDKLEMNKISELELENTSVTSLNLYGNFSQAGDLNLVLKIFKKLTELEVEMNNSVEPAVVLQMNHQLPHLDFLMITHCSRDFFDHLCLSGLKTLKLTDGSFSPEDWTRFARRNPSIESIKITDESITNETFRVICTEFLKLRSLEIFYDPQRLTSEILDFIFDENFPKNVKYVKLSHRSSSNEGMLVMTEDHKRFMSENGGFQFFS